MVGARARSGLAAVGVAIETAAPTASSRVHRAATVRQRESREERGAIAVSMASP